MKEDVERLRRVHRLWRAVDMAHPHMVTIPCGGWGG